MQLRTHGGRRCIRCRLRMDLRLRDRWRCGTCRLPCGRGWRRGRTRGLSCSRRWRRRRMRRLSGRRRWGCGRMCGWRCDGRRRSRRSRWRRCGSRRRRDMGRWRRGCCRMRRGRRRRCGGMRRRAGRRRARPLRLAGRRLAVRGLLRPTIGADFALRLRHHERGGLCVQWRACHLHRRQGGRRKQEETKFGHVISFPSVISVRARDEQTSVRPECGGVQTGGSIYFCRKGADERACS